SKLPEIADINMGQSPSSSDVNEHGEGIVFFQGKAEFGKLYPTPKKYCTKPTKIASAGDILLSVRAPVGPTNLANQSTAIGRGLAAISAYHGLMESRYLLYFFKCIEPWLSTQGTGSTFKAISGQFIRDLQSPVPP
ncbi:4'-phosphopantetheinyl transferase, partial [Escherichia coli]|uniref:restriction endonuclease subunit S n=2 Tax=Escherichia TaxID=561 RepID=UPI00132AA065